MSGIQAKIGIGLRILMGALFVMTGTAKLIGAPMMVQEFGLFAPFGIGQWFRILTGVIEIAGALLLIRRTTVFYGAALLTCVSLGAFVAQVMVLHKDWIHAIVIAALCGWLAWRYRPAAGGGI